jgi:hypothetical protein
VLVGFKMLDKLIDARRQKRDLHFRRTSIAGVHVIGLNNLLFSLCTKSHGVLLTLCRATDRETPSEPLINRINYIIKGVEMQKPPCLCRRIYFVLQYLVAW